MRAHACHNPHVEIKGVKVSLAAMGCGNWTQPLTHLSPLINSLLRIQASQSLYRENTSTNSRLQKTRRLSSPKTTGINRLPFGKNAWIIPAPRLINKDVFEPSYNNLKLQIWSCYSFSLTLLMKIKPRGPPPVSKSGQGQQNNQTKCSKDLVTAQRPMRLWVGAGTRGLCGWRRLVSGEGRECREEDTGHHVRPEGLGGEIGYLQG